LIPWVVTRIEIRGWISRIDPHPSSTVTFLCLFSSLRRLASLSISLSRPASLAARNKCDYYIRIRLRGLTCHGIKISDIAVTTTKISPTHVDFRVQLLGLDVACSVPDYYVYHDNPGPGSLGASGTLSVASTAATLDSSVRFTSPGYDHSGPTSSETTSCAATVPINANALHITGSNLLSGINTIMKTFGGGDNWVQHKIVDGTFL
jgi:hypothetical protein